MFITTKYSGSNGLDIETSIHNSLKNVRCPSLLTANGIWHVHDDGLFLHPRARAPNPDICSLALNTWICTSSTTRVSRGRISRRLGPRWKPSSEPVSPSKPAERVDGLGGPPCLALPRPPRAEMVRLTCCPLGASASATLGLMTSKSCWHPPKSDPPRTRYVRFGQEGSGGLGWGGVVENPRGVAQLRSHTATVADPPTPLRVHTSGAASGVHRGPGHRFRGVLCSDVTSPPLPSSLPAFRWLVISRTYTT